jgi:hypothetical protein
LPTQVYQVPPPASSPYPYDYPYPVDYAYPEFFPYWVGAPWFFGLAPSIVVVQRFHHFHYGFPRGFAHVSPAVLALASALPAPAGVVDGVSRDEARS